MKMTAELSVYPLRDNFKDAVLGFLDELLANADIVAVTNSMSTQVSGEDDAIFRAIQASLRASHERFGRQVLVAKFIPEHFADIGPEG